MPFELFGKLGLDGRGFNNGLKRASSAVGGFAKSTKAALKMVGITYGAYMIKDQIAKTIEWGAAIRDLGVRFGVTTEFVQKMEYAFNQTGVELEAGMNAFRKMQIYQHRALSQFRGGNRRGELVAAFELLGATIDDIENKNPDELFMHIAQHLKSANTNSQGMQEAIHTVFGSVGSKMLNTFRVGVQGLHAEFEKLGMIVEDRVVNQLGATSDKLDYLEKRSKKLFVGAGAFIFDNLNNMNDYRKAMSDMYSQNMTTIMTGGLMQKLTAGADMFNMTVTGGLIRAGEVMDRQSKIRNERLRKEKEEAQRDADRVNLAADRQNDLVDANKAKTAEAREIAKKAEEKRRAVWGGFGPDRLEKVGGRIGMATTQLNVSQRQLEEMIKAQKIREQQAADINNLRRFFRGNI